MTAPQQSIHDLIAGFITTREIKLPVFNPVALRLQQALARNDIKITEIERMRCV